MITFIIPSLNSPVGLKKTVESFQTAFGDMASFFVCLFQHDKTLPLSVRVCEEVHASYATLASPLIPAAVNLAVREADTPFVCVQNDSTQVSFETERVLPLIRSTLAGYPDEIIALHLCFREIFDGGEDRGAILSRKAAILLGYLYHPILNSIERCEKWNGTVYDEAGRCGIITGVRYSPVAGHPTETGPDAESVHMDNLMYNATYAMRKMSGGFLKGFLAIGGE